MPVLWHPAKDAVKAQGQRPLHSRARRSIVCITASGPRRAPQLKGGACEGSDLTALVVCPGPSSSHLDLLIAGLGVLPFADAAIETWPHAAMRWWVIGFALVYAVVAALSLVRRVSSATKSVLALATLLLLIAATAWLPGGTTDGVRLFTLSTPRVLNARDCDRRCAGRSRDRRGTKSSGCRPAVLALLALYGAAAFGLGAVDDVPVAALLSGASLWYRLPAFLQGAVIGAAVVLPIGIVALVVSAGLRRPNGNALGAQAAKAVVLVTSAAIALASAPFRTGTSTAYRCPGDARHQVPVRVAASALHDVPRLSTPELTAALDNSFRAIADGERRAPRIDGMSLHWPLASAPIR